MVEFVVTLVVCSLDMSSCSTPRSYRAEHASVEACVDAESLKAATRMLETGHEGVLLLACDYYWPAV